MVPLNSIADLTADGPLDWVHWGTHSEYGWNRKVNVPPRIGQLVPIISASGSGPYRYADNQSGFRWSDGTPDLIVTNTTTGVWAISKDSGFQLTVPADTTLKRLKVYVGAFQARAQMNAWLSDGSAPAYSDSSIDIADNAPGGVYTLTFAANSPGQTLTVTYVVLREHDNKVGNVTWQAAALSYASLNNPPSTTLTNPPDNAVFSAGSNIPLGALASDSDGAVTNVAFFQGGTKLGSASAPPWNLLWTNVAPGAYVLQTVATDNGGLCYTSAPVEVFVHTNGGYLGGSLAPVPPAVDLTVEGPQDWIHWGYGWADAIDRKASVPARIPDFAQLGNNALVQVSDYPVGFSWSDGTPNAAAYTTAAVSVAGLTNGFELAVPAMTYTQTLAVYVGLYASQGTLQAFLSDFSAPAFTDSSIQTFYNRDFGFYTLGFAAAAPGQNLKVRYTSSAQYDMTYDGNVCLAAATLAGIAPPEPPHRVTLVTVSGSGGGFTFSFLTQSNRNHSVEWTESLNPPAWQPLTNFQGDGTLATITDPAAGITSRFYRVSTY